MVVRRYIFSGTFFKIFMVLLGSVILLASQIVYAQEMEFNQGINHVSLEHDNVKREFLLYLPKNYNPKNIYPVLFAFHGGGGKWK